MSSALVMHVRRAKWLPAWALRTSIVRGLAVPCHRLPCAVHLFCGVVASSFLEWCSLGLAVPCFSARGPLLLHLSRALFRGGVAWGPLASLFCGLLLQAIVLSWGLVCVCRVYRGKARPEYTDNPKCFKDANPAINSTHAHKAPG